MTKAQGDLSVLHLAMEAYYKNVGHYPTMYSNYQTTFMNTPNPILTQYLYDPFAPEKNTVYQYTHSEVPLMQSRYYVINTDNMEPHYQRRGETTRHAWVDEQGIVTWEGHVIWRSNGHAQ
jgi:hypothetical protein